MAKAELQLDISANNAKAKKALQEVKKEGVNAVEEITAKNNEATKAFLGMFAPVALAMTVIMTAITSVTEAIRGYFDAGKVFQDIADKADVSAQSIAYLKAMADSAGVSAEDFERAMQDLSTGERSIKQLREEWQALGDEIKTATLAQENFERAGRKRNFESWGDASATFWGGLAGGALEMVGAGGKQLSAIERGAYEGKTLEEALQMGQEARSWYSLPITRGRQEDVYHLARAKMARDEADTQNRLIENTATKLADADISETQRVDLFRERTGQSWSNEAIIALAESLKTTQEKFADTIADAVEQNKQEIERKKKEAEAEKKAKAEAEKLKAEEVKIGQALKETFTTGDGLINNVNYGIKYSNEEAEALKIARQQLSEGQRQRELLKSIDDTLKGE